MPILQAIAQSNIHVLVVSKTGNGGTTTLLGLIDEINKTHENRCQFFIISLIHQKWMGLENTQNEYQLNGKETSSPAVVCSFGIDIRQAIEQIKVVHTIFDQRRQDNLAEIHSDISLVIDEWTSLKESLKQASKEVYDSVILMLVDIVQMGRRFNIRLILNTQSGGICDNGFSNSTKHCFTTLAQERINKNDRCQLIPKTMQDPLLFDSADLPRLKNELNEIYRNVTGEYQIVGLSSLSWPTIEILPNLTDLRDTVLFSQ